MPEPSLVTESKIIRHNNRKSQQEHCWLFLTSTLAGSLRAIVAPKRRATSDEQYATTHDELSHVRPAFLACPPSPLSTPMWLPFRDVAAFRTCRHLDQSCRRSRRSSQRLATSRSEAADGTSATRAGNSQR